MVKKICLIWPFDYFLLQKNHSWCWLPSWAISLATYLKEKFPEIDIYILDGQIDKPETIIERIRVIKPEIVGISIAYAYYDLALMFAREAKQIGAKVIMGGVHATSLKKEILINRGPYSEDYCVDAIIKRDGEKAFSAFVAGEPLEKINNLVYQDINGQIKENKTELFNLNDLPIPNFDLIETDRYFNLSKINNKVINTYFSKGCSWRQSSGGCIFCSSVERELRNKSAKKAFNEIKSLAANFNNLKIRIDDEDFLGDLVWFEKFINIYSINKKKDMPNMWVDLRADKITPWNIGRLKQINVDTIFIGIETATQPGLVNINKGISKNTITKAINLLDKENIYIVGSFVYGVPGESKDSLKKTFALIKELANIKAGRIIYQIFTPIPGSLSWTMLAEKTGEKYKNKDLIDYNEVRKDWLRHFCDLTLPDLKEFEEKIKQLANKRENIRFSLVHKIR